MTSSYEREVAPGHFVNIESGDNHFFYTIVDEDDPDNQQKADIYVQKTNSGCRVYLQMPKIGISQQQLCELGWLFLALAGNDVDHSSAAELLDGYKIAVPDTLISLLKDEA